MPIFEYLCTECGNLSEQLVFSGNEEIRCPHCRSDAVKKLISATSRASGAKTEGRLPTVGDTGCCGHQPGAQGCTPGSCCGKV